VSAPLGFSGRLARTFLDHRLTPLLALIALLSGLFAVLVTPREEEPQIDVTFANVFVAFPGASAAQVESLVATPMEQVLAEIAGVKHIYSASRPGLAVLTVQFVVGEPRNEAIVRLYNAIYSNQDWRPPGLGVQQPLVRPGSIDDVPVLTVTFWSQDPATGTADLARVARSVEAEVQRVPGTRDVYTLGAPAHLVHVELDAARLRGHGLTIDEVSRALQGANLVQHAGALTAGNAAVPVQAGRFLADRGEVAGLVVGLSGGRPVALEDVATVTDGADQPDAFAWFGTGAARAARDLPAVDNAPAVTLAVAKKPGQNAIDVADGVLRRLELLRATHIPERVQMTVTRNYGVTANDKAQKLIQKLLFATASVVLLVVLAMGRREAIVVGAAVIITLAATLFASWAWGFTINRVSLFALIFSIGILVDDAIVVVENIHRHLVHGGALDEVIPSAVDEVGGPTILATFTVIAALLPMAFVSGLMGPYMSPIPINASMGMLISLAVALVFTPWLTRKLLANAPHAAAGPSKLDAWVERTFVRLMRPFLDGGEAKRRRHRLYGGIVVAIAAAVGLAVVQLVVLKMLPFDNKSEFQVVLDMPEGTPVEDTARVLDEMAQVVAAVPEVTDFQAYAGTAAPINFNGLVRQYSLRQATHLGDLQVNLTDKHDRSRSSHEIARDVRPALAAIATRHGAVVQVVEVPPGPPVQAPIVAEVYGPTREARDSAAVALREAFRTEPDVVDINDSLEGPARRLVIVIDRTKAARLGVQQSQVAGVIATALGGADVTYLRAGSEQQPVAVRLELPVADQADAAALLRLEVRAAGGGRVPLGAVASVEDATWDGTLHHKDLLPVTYVTGDMAGDLDSPLYGMFGIVGRAGDGLPGLTGLEQRFTSPPEDPASLAVKWDGEWQVTFETFRDMGLAYSVGLLLIYLLVVGQFGSYAVPLIIMAPIPLTIIGVMPGHALLGAQFTATSMIGMIALAGIIVRNSILLVDFINVEIAAGRPLADAVVQASVVRAKPIVLTALAAMTGALFILDDPIFNGLAISLIFGIAVSTLLTLVLIPVIYYAYLLRAGPPPAAVPVSMSTD
jgi:multidrug efflux pump subunit AcrB